MTDRDTPLEGLEDLFERLNRRFGTAARSWESELEGRSHLDLSMGGSGTSLDLADEGDSFVATVDVPGYAADDLDLELRGETLRISGERDQQFTTETNDPDDSGATYLRRERGTQSFSRAVELPAPVDSDEVTAMTNNGVLTVWLPKLEPTDGPYDISIE